MELMFLLTRNRQLSKPVQRKRDVHLLFNILCPTVSKTANKLCTAAIIKCAV